MRGTVAKRLRAEARKSALPTKYHVKKFAGRMRRQRAGGGWPIFATGYRKDCQELKKAWMKGKA